MEEGYFESDLCEKWKEDTSYDNAQHINGLLLEEDDFLNLYDKENIPVIIRNVMSDWKAIDWTLESLSQKYEETNFLVGSHTVLEERSPMKFKFFLEYMEKNKDDTPLMIHDYGFNRRQSTKPLKNEYEEPTFFGKDYFSYMAEARRPPWRYFTIAPQRSGLRLHRNTYKESIWEGVITGKRRYVLWEPESPKELIKGTSVPGIEEKYAE